MIKCDDKLTKEILDSDYFQAVTRVMTNVYSIVPFKCTVFECVTLINVYYVLDHRCDNRCDKKERTKKRTK